MNKNGDEKALIEGGGAVLGCELGSTVIKSTLISRDGRPLTSGAHQWENRLVDGAWTYPIDESIRTRLVLTATPRICSISPRVMGWR
jgi:hypothetical protein